MGSKLKLSLPTNDARTLAAAELMTEWAPGWEGSCAVLTSGVQLGSPTRFGLPVLAAWIAVGGVLDWREVGSDPASGKREESGTAPAARRWRAS